MIYPTFLDHLVLRVAELARSERFYTAILSRPESSTEDSLMYRIGETRLFLTVAASTGSLQNKEDVGLNHLAFGVRSLSDLHAIQAQLDESGIAHSGILLDHYGSTQFLWLDDPDRLRLEFYVRAT